MENNRAQMEYFWKKKEFISFVLCILVFLIHISSFSPYLAGEGGTAVLNEKLSFFFKESITRFAVPMFFILSGIAFFRDYTNQKYLSKIKTRFFSLCIPYLIWNTLWMIFDLVCSCTVISSFFVGRKMFELSVLNIFKGIFIYGANPPFWYIFYLIIFVLLSPLIDLLVRNKYIGIAITAVLASLSIFRIGNYYGFSYNAIVFYFLGAVLGKHYFAAVVKKTGRISRIFSAMFLFVYILFKNLFPINEYYLAPFIKIVVFTLASYALWSLVDLFMDKISMRPIYTRSFLVYAMHINISAIIYKICYLLLPKNGYMAIPNFLLTFTLTLLIINVFCIVVERFFPSVYALLIGKRIKIQRKKISGADV